MARVYVGDGNSLELVSLHVTTTVEGPRARTVVDHVFRNPHDKVLEGTFEYPLPSGASPSLLNDSERQFASGPRPRVMAGCGTPEFPNSRRRSPSMRGRLSASPRRTEYRARKR